MTTPYEDGSSTGFTVSVARAPVRLWWPSSAVTSTSCNPSPEVTRIVSSPQ
jgi:hypothetical protein